MDSRVGPHEQSHGILGDEVSPFGRIDGSERATGLDWRIYQWSYNPCIFVIHKVRFRFWSFAMLFFIDHNVWHFNVSSLTLFHIDVVDYSWIQSGRNGWVVIQQLHKVLLLFLILTSVGNFHYCLCQVSTSQLRIPASYTILISTLLMIGRLRIAAIV